MTIPVFWRRGLALLLLSVASHGAAQEPASVRNVLLPALDAQVAARIIALDARLNPVHSPPLAAGLLGRLAWPDSGSLAPLLSDPRNNAVWAQLADDYAQMALDSGDLLASLTETPTPGTVAWPSMQVRRLCHARLARLPRSVLQTYRRRVDTEAKALLAQAKLTRSDVPLRRLIDDFFCSSVTDEALDLLGDLAFERGEFEEARQWWRMLLPSDSSREDELRYPDPKIAPARVEAKRILARIFQGRFEEAEVELRRYGLEHPKASGALAGESGHYHAILAKALTTVVQARLRNNDEPWTTFAGNAMRNPVLSHAPLPALWEDGPTWRVKLPALKTGLARGPMFHPVIVRQQILIADHRSVVSYHLHTGKELFRFDLRLAGLSDPGPHADVGASSPRFTLTADAERVYARLGPTPMGSRNGERPGASYLVCLDITEPAQAKNREVWHVRARGDDKMTLAFEGAPLVHGGFVYVALSRVRQGRNTTSIVCYDRHGRQRWAREVCETPELDENGHGPRGRQHLLTWAAGQIVYCSHSGAIVAVDARTGVPTWAVRYPSRGTLTNELAPSPRDLAPCLACDGCVFAAPADSDRVFCMDAVSGALRWELDGLEAAHVLGAAQGRLYLATRDGTAAIDAASGAIAWKQPSDGKLPSLGRGVLAGGWLLWPTRDPQLPYRAVSLSHGRQSRDKTPTGTPARYEPSVFHTLPPGNWALGEGCLAIAGLSELSVYIPSHRLPNGVEPRPQARREAGLPRLAFE